MITGHNHTSFTVGDVDRSVDFYTNTLGFKLEGRFETQGPGIEQVTGLSGAHLLVAFVYLGDFRLELIQYAAPRGVKLDTSTNNVGSAHVALWVDDIDKTYADLKAKGVQFKGAPMSSRPGRPRVAYFTDPDGMTLELVSEESV